MGGSAGPSDGSLDTLADLKPTPQGDSSQIMFAMLFHEYGLR